MTAWLALVFASSPLWAMSPPPAAPVMTPAEEVQLAAGEVVVRYQGLPGGGTLAVVDVSASPQATFAAVVDLEARVADIGALKSVEVYERSPRTLAATWELGIAVYSITFSVRYEVDHAAGWCVYDLDGSKENGVSFARGSYQVLPREGGSRILYRAEADAEQKGPDWVRKKLAYGSSTELLLGMKRRAEAAP